LRLEAENSTVPFNCGSHVGDGVYRGDSGPIHRGQNTPVLCFDITCRGNRVNVKKEKKHLPEFDVRSLLKSPTIKIRDTYCRGTCRSQGPEEYTPTTQLVFAYRGAYVRHVGQNQAVAEANQVLFFNAMEGYRVSHPVAGGDASLTLIIEESQLHELAPSSLLQDGPRAAFRLQRLRIDARTQALVALLRHSLRENTAEPLEAETL